MDGWIDYGQRDRRTDGQMDRWTDRQTDQTDRQMDGWMDGRMDRYCLNRVFYRKLEMFFFK